MGIVNMQVAVVEYDYRECFRHFMSCLADNLMDSDHGNNIHSWATDIIDAFRREDYCSLLKAFQEGYAAVMLTDVSIIDSLIVNNQKFEVLIRHDEKDFRFFGEDIRL